MIGSLDHNRIDAAILQQPAEVAIRCGAAATGGYTFREARLVNVADGGQLYIWLSFEVVYVLACDEPVADEADPHAVVGPAY
jgi:hypothetical protein